MMEIYREGRPKREGVEGGGRGGQRVQERQTEKQKKVEMLKYSKRPWVSRGYLLVRNANQAFLCSPNTCLFLHNFLTKKGKIGRDRKRKA
jgi:hypothetical protein